MKLNYYSETDSLYIDLAERPSATTLEIAPGVAVDFDTAGQVVGIDIDHASRLVNLTRVEGAGMPPMTLAPGALPPPR